MKIALDISPLTTGHYLQHRVRGTGFYLKSLQQSFAKYSPDDEYLVFSRGERVPEDAEVIHYPYFEPFFLTLPVRKQKKQIVTVHDLTPLVFPEHFPAGIRGKIRWSLQRHALQQSDAIITDSFSSKNDIIRFTGLPEQRVHVVYLAAGEGFRQVDKRSARAVLEKKHSLPEKYALYVGDATWNKNLPRLIRAVKKAAVPLVMTGKALTDVITDTHNPWNKDLVEVQQLVKGDALIHRLGFVSTDDLVLLYNCATVSVMPSLYEGFGLPILEAMSCGSPVIATKEGSLPEVGGESVFYVGAQSEDAIAEGIKKVFNDSGLRQKLSEKGIDQAKKFSWKKTAIETREVYRAVTGND